MDSTNIFRREDDADLLLNLLKDPFAGTLQSASVISALTTSLGFTAAIAVIFSLLRPYNTAVYAPRLKHADEKHAPPPIGKSPWAWITPLWSTKEAELVHFVGMDATIFLRFTRMCRNMFLVMTLVGCAILIPVHLTKSDKDLQGAKKWISQITPEVMWNEPYWADVAVAYLFNIIICGFLWFNSKKVLQLRRQYFDSEEYQNSMHARTLMLIDLPTDKRSDEGIHRILDEAAPQASFPRTAVARNVKELPTLIEEHGQVVRKLEKVLAKYLKKPDQLPPSRPECKPSKKDPSYGTYPAGQKLDAISYYTQRIRELETRIKEVRASVDMRSTMPYGFATYSDIAEAHNVAYSCRKKHPFKSTIRLAPRPNDIIWENMVLDAGTRKRRRLMNYVWTTLLTIIWIVPSAFIAVFLVNLSNLGKVWPAFKAELERNPKFWGAAGGVVSPAVLSLFYVVLPIIFRRMSIKAGDQTKTGRERHVFAKLYAFFVFNNLIVLSLFGAIWQTVSLLVDASKEAPVTWATVEELHIGDSFFVTLCNISPFWVTWLLQRHLGAAIDLSQLWPLVRGFFMRKFSSPTPRELIELTAPPPFAYANYYNYFLFYATVALCYSCFQPLVLPAAALYFCIDVWLKKYLLLYIFVTKTESGGKFWRALFNRFVFAVILADLVFFFVCWVRGLKPVRVQAIAIVPLPFLMVGFKVFCKRMFDNKMDYYSTRDVRRMDEQALSKEGRLRTDKKLASRFGHPALYKPLITPMVHKKAQNKLPSVYEGRLSDGRDAYTGDTMSVSGYSDTYALGSMKAGKPGKPAGVPGFEFVSEERCDFEYYKSRAEFTDEHGGAELFGTARPGTPSIYGGSNDSGSRPGTPMGGLMGRRNFTNPSTFSPDMAIPPPTHGGFTQQPAFGDPPSRSRSPFYASQANDSTSGLVTSAAAMPAGTPVSGPGSRPGSRSRSRSRTREGSVDRGYNRSNFSSPGPAGATIGALGGGPRGYSGVPQSDESQDPSAYDYFRHNRHGDRQPGSGW